MSETATRPIQNQPLPALQPHSASVTFWVRILVVAQLMLLGVEFSPDFSTNGDDAKYYLLGKSLFGGNGYRDLFDPQNPVQTQYPPLFPAVIGAIGTISSTPLLPKIVIGTIGATLLLLLFGYLRRFEGPLLLPLLLVVTLSSSIASHATLLMSEIPYCIATLAALILLEKYRERGGTGLLFWAAALVALAPALIRTVGISFTAAWIVVNFLEKRHRQAMAHLLLFAGAMLLLRMLTEWHNPYVDQLLRKSSYDPELGFASAGELATRFANNIILYLFTIIPQTLLGLELNRNGAVTLSLLLMVPAVTGLVRNFRRPTSFLSYYLCAYGFIICLWQNQWSGPRFIIPIVPFLYYFILLGLQAIVPIVARWFIVPAKGSENQPRPVAPAAVWAAAVIIALVNIGGHVRLLNSNDGLTNDWRNFYSCADWVRTNTPSDAIVVTRKPELFYPRSQRKGFVYPFSHDVDVIIKQFKERNVRYCVLDNFSWTNTSVRYLFPAIMGNPDKFRVVYSLRNPDTFVLEFVAK